PEEPPEAGSAAGVLRGAAPPTGAGRLRSECAESLSAVPAAHWDALVDVGGTPLKHGFLRAWEQSELRGLRSRPVLAHVGSRSEPVGACPGYFYDLDIANARFPQSLLVVRALRRLWPGLAHVRTYELGHPTPLTSPFLLADHDRDAELVRSMIDAGVEEGDRGGASFVLAQNFTSTDGPAGERLAQLGFAPLNILPSAVVDLPYASFDDYLGSMRAQYRRRAQKALERSASLHPEHRGRFDDLADELARLWKAIYDRAREIRREVLTPDFFRAASQLEETHVLLMRRDDATIASFALLIDDGPWLAFVQCGFESRAGRDEGAYFRLLYEIIRFAIERGYEQVDLGITTLTPKLDVGAVPVPLIAWLRHRNPIAQRVIRRFGQGAMHLPELEARRVFKEAPPSAAELVARRGLSW
ncbi:MAG TPA: GNAT family N-acetyltransferase, partial [Solirubrobacteraceae bacterium]|nr:GNAT family N-acetyltransferase [Solirubrobacteraceae bacterium]